MNRHIAREARTLTAAAGAALGLMAILAAAPSVAAQEISSRWLPWTGCWEVLGAGAQSDVVCVEPGQDASEVTLNYVREEVEDVVIRADGAPAPVTQAGCEGEETAEFSPDGSRVYIKARYTCEGGEEQTGTGLLAMLSEDEWIEIRSLTLDGETMAWVQRYVQATPAAVQAAGETDPVTPNVILARRVAARAPTLNTMAEVSFAVDPKVASAWIVESGYQFKLNGNQLIALADAGVPEEVIDVAVAVSNPDRFNIGPQGDPTRQAPAARDGRGTTRMGFMPYFGRRFYNYGGWYSPWGFMYSPFGYDPYYGYNYGYGGYWGGYRPTYIVVTPRTGGDSGGRAVAGRGYTQGRGSSAPSGSQGGWSPPRSGSSGSGGSSSGGSSTGSSTSGGSSSPPRTAKPRGGGGGI